MSNGIVMIAAGLWGQLFPERQIYLHSHGQVRCVSLRPGVQFAGAAMLLSAISWMTIVLADYAFQHGALAGRDAQIVELRTSYVHLSTELADVQRRFLSTTLELEAKRRQLADVLAQNGAANAGGAVPAGAQIVSETKSITHGLLPRPRPEGQQGDSDNFQTDVIPRERPARAAFTLPSSMTDLSGSLKYGYTRSDDTRLSDAKSTQNDVVAYLAADAATAIGTLEKLINQTGLDADTMLRRRDNENVSAGLAEGGPYLAVPPSMTGRFLRRNAPGEMAMTSTRKGRLEMLREALFSLPLAEPVDKYYVSSRYGYRSDPFTHAKAFHSGVDMVAPHGYPVRSSAPGTVIFAGRNGPYGNMVEVDHGRGVKSRYGHLSKINVVRGQKIGLLDLIGLVGNTGRSGTAHLHFEVWFDGKARDPRNFLKAGENVFQRQG